MSHGFFILDLLFFFLVLPWDLQYNINYRGYCGQLVLFPALIGMFLRFALNICCRFWYPLWYAGFAVGSVYQNNEILLYS